MPELLQPRAGALLVATPAIGDPNFERTVILVLQHDDEGTLGVILNRPSDLTVAETVPAWQSEASAPSVVHLGGPVGQGGMLALARIGATAPVRGWSELSAGLGALDLTLDPLEVGGDLTGLRLFAGYAGWGAGQLRGELMVGAWWIFDALKSDVFSSEPDELWWQVVRRQGGDFRMYAFAPLDPSVN
jgi:putative transcriptional regulator